MKVILAAARGRIAAGAFSLIASRVTSGLATLVATPILFSRLGPTVFGLWTVLLGAAGIAAYADAGLGTTLLRETAGAHTGADALRRAQGALALAFVVSSVSGVALAASVFAAWPAITSGLRLEGLAGAARIAALILIASVVVGGWGSAGRAALEGTGRIPKVAAVSAVSAALTAVLAVLAVLDGDGLIGLALATLAGAIVRAATLTAMARRAEPQLRPRLGVLRRGELKALLRYGGAVQLSQTGGAVNSESDRIVVSGVAGLAPAAGLDLGLRLANLVGLVPFCVLYALFPVLARLAAEGERGQLDALYVRASRWVGGASMVPAVLLAVCAPSAVVLWLGHPVPFAAACLVVLCPAIGIGSLTGVASAICRAEGVPGRETRFVAGTAALNVVLTIVLAATLGPIGVPVATAAATILGTAGFLVSFHRLTQRPAAMLLRALGWPLAAALGTGGGAFLAGLLAPGGVDRLHAAAAIALRLAGALAAVALLGASAVLMRSRRACAPAHSTGNPAGELEWVVYLSAIAWEGPRNRQQELAAQLARGRRVLFVEAPHLRPAWKLRIDTLDGSLWRARPLALLPLGRFLPWVNRVNRRYSGWRLRRWLDRRPGDRIVVLDEDLAAPLVSRLKARLLIYDGADLDWTFTRKWNRRHLQTALSEAVATVDLVLTSSTVLAQHLPPTRGPVLELLNACDPEHFGRPTDVPFAIRRLPQPRIGYVGAIDDRAFDSRLLVKVAHDRPDWTFVLAGPANSRVALDFAALANVHLVGRVPYADLPGVVAGFDVCLIPYRIGERIDYVQPKKLFEYLAAGKPVVTTALPALSQLDVPYRVATTAEAFASRIDEALLDCDAIAAEARRACAQGHTWEIRGHTLRAILDGFEVAR
ncbi:MAG: oligosaccharide flippase family protein [Solirubrobacteraceae bacterium]